MRPTLKQLLAEHPDLEQEIEEYNRESKPSIPYDPLAIAESQQIFVESWESSSDVPEMLTPEQAEQAMARIAKIRAEKIAECQLELDKFERSYSGELHELLENEKCKKNEVAEARRFLQVEEARLKEAVSDARVSLRNAESQLASFKSSGVAMRTSLHSENRRVKAKYDSLHAEIYRAVQASKRKYVEMLDSVKKMHNANTQKMHWDRMAFETQMRKSKVRDAFGITRGRPRTRDEDDEPADDWYFEPADDAASQPPRGISLPPMDEHPMIEGPAPTEEPAKKRDPEKVVPWEELAAECLVQPQDYADWSMNYASGWGNNKRIDFARKRILARRVGAEIPDWPEEIIPGLYLGRSKLPTDLARFYSEVPEDKLMKPAGIVPPSDSLDSSDPGIL